MNGVILYTLLQYNYKPYKYEEIPTHAFIKYIAIYLLIYFVIHTISLKKYYLHLIINVNNKGKATYCSC